MKNLPKSIMMSLVVSTLACSHSNTPPIKTNELPKTSAIKEKQLESTFNADWINVAERDSTFIVALPYATPNNFLKEKIYPCAKCFLRKDAANALLKAQKEALRKGLRIILYDCYRPLPLQQKMFDIKPDTKYVADPKRGSKHNKGVAVDVGLADMEGNILNMGSAFDDFSEKANYNSKEVTAEAKTSRTLLRHIMISNGFTPYDNEWWHFNYKKSNFENAKMIWACD